MENHRRQYLSLNPGIRIKPKNRHNESLSITDNRCFPHAPICFSKILFSFGFPAISDKSQYMFLLLTFHFCFHEQTCTRLVVGHPLLKDCIVCFLLSSAGHVFSTKTDYKTNLKTLSHFREIYHLLKSNHLSVESASLCLCETAEERDTGRMYHFTEVLFLCFWSSKNSRL